VATSTRSRKPLAWDIIREIGLTLPETEEGLAWGTPVLRTRGHIIAGIPIHKSAEPGSLMVRVETTARDEMIAEQPDIYYTAAHYENYPCVLVRLSRVSRDILEDLLRLSHRFANTTRPGKRRPSAGRRRASKRPSRKRT
jgi:hypothetical protein